MRTLKHKYHAKPTTVDNVRYDSKLEASYAQQLKLRQKAGDVVFWLRQVPIQLPGNVKYRVDFVVFEADGSIHWIDCKGMNTPISTLKQKQVAELYPFDIEIVRKV